MEKEQMQEKTRDLLEVQLKLLRMGYKMENVNNLAYLLLFYKMVDDPITNTQKRNVVIEPDKKKFMKREPALSYKELYELCDENGGNYALVVAQYASKYGNAVGLFKEGIPIEYECIQEYIPDMIKCGESEAGWLVDKLITKVVNKEWNIHTDNFLKFSEIMAENYGKTQYLLKTYKEDIYDFTGHEEEINNILKKACEKNPRNIEDIIYSYSHKILDSNSKSINKEILNEDSVANLFIECLENYKEEDKDELEKVFYNIEEEYGIEESEMLLSKIYDIADPEPIEEINL